MGCLTIDLLANGDTVVLENECDGRIEGLLRACYKEQVKFWDPTCDWLVS